MGFAVTLPHLHPDRRITKGADKILAPHLVENEVLLWASPVNLFSYLRAAAGRLFYAMLLLVFSSAVLGAGVIATAFLLQIGGADGEPEARTVFSGPGAFVLPLALSILAMGGIVGALSQFAIVIRGAFTMYAVTDRRCLVVSPGAPSLRAWIPLTRVLGVHARRKGQTGTLKLTVAPLDGPPVLTALTLHGIGRVDAVEALLIDLIAPSADERVE